MNACKSKARIILFVLISTLTLTLTVPPVHASSPGTGGTWISGQPIPGGGGAGTGVVRLSTHAVLRVTASIHNSDLVRSGISNGWTNPRNPDIEQGLLFGGSGNPRSNVTLIGVAVGSDIETRQADITWQGGTGSTLQMAHTLLLNNGPFTGTGPNFGSVPVSAVANHISFAQGFHDFLVAHNLNINNLNARFPTAGDWATLSPQQQVEAAVAAMVVADAYGLNREQVNIALLGTGETFLVITLEALYTMETANPPRNYLGDHAWVSSWEIARAVTGVSSHTGSTHNAFGGQGGVVNSSLGVVQGLRRAEGSPPTPLFQAFNQFFAGANAAGTTPLFHNARARQMFYYRIETFCLVTDEVSFQADFNPNAANTKTSVRYKVSRKTVYKWRDRYDGTPESLKDKSHKPHTHPKAHTQAEIDMIRNALKKVKWQDLLLAYQRLTDRGYTRSCGGFKKVVQKLRNLKPKKPKPKKKPKPYTKACCPGQKIQIDVKYVPRECIVGGQSYYQFTAADECTRWTFRQMYDERSCYCAKQFLDELMATAPFPIRMVQTDNGTEFTNALLVVKAAHKTLFEQALEDMDILYKRIRIATPRHNGKVERMHRTDQMRFYGSLRMYNLADGRKQTAAYNKRANGYIMTCLSMKSPSKVLAEYLAIM